MAGLYFIFSFCGVLCSEQASRTLAVLHKLIELPCEQVEASSADAGFYNRQEQNLTTAHHSPINCGFDNKNIERDVFSLLYNVFDSKHGFGRCYLVYVQILESVFQCISLQICDVDEKAYIFDEQIIHFSLKISQ